MDIQGTEIKTLRGAAKLLERQATDVSYTAEVLDGAIPRVSLTTFDAVWEARGSPDGDRPSQNPSRVGRPI
jgi:hypothetical protein